MNTFLKSKKKSDLSRLFFLVHLCKRGCGGDFLTCKVKDGCVFRHGRSSVLQRWPLDERVAHARDNKTLRLRRVVLLVERILGAIVRRLGLAILRVVCHENEAVLAVGLAIELPLVGVVVGLCRSQRGLEVAVFARLRRRLVVALDVGARVQVGVADSQLLALLVTLPDLNERTKFSHLGDSSRS